MNQTPQAPENPQGRLDILTIRVAEVLGRQFAPAEWPVFQPFVEDWARRTFGPERRTA
jgi:hypothetical protein